MNTPKVRTPWLLGVLALLLLISASGCDRSEDILLTEVDNGRQVEIYPGQTLVITLDSNPTTGFIWEVAETNPLILSQRGEAEFIAPESNLVGAGGREVFRFECLEAGRSPLELIYHRPWESEEPLDTFRVEVIARQ